MHYDSYKTNYYFFFFLFTLSEAKKLNIATRTPTVIGLQCHYVPTSFKLKYKPNFPISLQVAVEM